ncbi:hypothetical protein BH23CHL8_BH23CHL8_21700 [soil metagenome]
MGDPQRYARRVSGPLLDRIDLRVVMPRLPADELVSTAEGEPSRAVAARIHAAWARATRRNGGLPNGTLSGRRVVAACQLEAVARRSVTEIEGAQQLTARGIHRLLSVARTVADLEAREQVGREHILAAAGLRERIFDAEVAA